MNYHAQPGLSFSQLKVFAESPRLYEATFITKSIERKPSTAMDLGTALHMMLLEPHVAMTDLIRIPPEVLSKSGSKSGKAWDDFEQEHAGKVLLKHREYVHVTNAAKAVREHSIAGKLMAAEGEYEVPINWEWDGIPMRSKLDKICNGGMVVDLKTTADCGERAFSKTVADQLYHLQALMYLQAAAQHTECPVTGWRFAWIAAEVEPPYRVRCYRLSDEAQSIADGMFYRLVKQFKECSESGIWADRDEDRLIDLMLPQYAIWKEVSEL